MDTNKPLTADELEKLKSSIRQRFDDLYHRIGSNRQKLFTTVLIVDQSISKELTREQIDSAHERSILAKVRDIERIANNQLPHMHRLMVPTAPTAKIAAPKPPAEKTVPVKTPPAKAPEVKVPVAKTPPAKTPATKPPPTKTPAAKSSPTKTKNKKETKAKPKAKKKK